jgi:2-C-methyl-D-erythritol 4-phosphate cytidylyltransferase
VPLSGQPMIEWSIAAFRASPSVGPIVVACPPGHRHEFAGDYLTTVDGGATRAQSVANALAAVDTDLVAIHDAARPLVTAALIEEVIAALEADFEAAGAIAAAPVTDTIKRVGEGMRPPFAISEMAKGGLAVEETLDRGRLWRAQTPQVFRVVDLREALGAEPEGLAEATDEASLVEAAGGRVLIHPSSPENLKVTAPLDLRLAELLLADRAG